MGNITIDIKNLIESLHVDANGKIKEDIKQLIKDKIDCCIEILNNK